MFRLVPVSLRTLIILLPLLLSSCGGSGKTEKLADGEVLVEAERVAASKPKTPKDIKPYDEALAWHEYHVKRVLDGKLDADTIRVAHWTVLAAKAVSVSTKKGEVVKLKLMPYEMVPDLNDIAKSDDLDVTTAPPRFLDLTQPLEHATSSKVFRYDYRGNVSEQMRLYWKLRGQLRAVVMGNSHATKGVNPRAIMDADNWGHPAMLNLSPAGSNNDFQCLMLREYVVGLPKLEWLLWVVSPRNYNKEKVDMLKYDSFTSSPGWNYDQKHKSELFPVPATQKLMDIDQLKAAMGPMGLDAWGSLNIVKSLLPDDPVALRKVILDECDRACFLFDDEAFKKLCDTARLFSEKGVKVLIFTTPFHPYTKDAVACDPDHTTHEGFREIVRHFEEFDRATPHLWFRDFNKDGSHEFPLDEFYDVDHLDRKGSSRLGSMIKKWMADCAAEDSALGAQAK